MPDARRLLAVLLAPPVALVVSSPVIAAVQHRLSYDIVAMDLGRGPLVDGAAVCLAFLVVAYATAGLVGAPVWWLVTRLLTRGPAAASVAAAVATVAAVALHLAVLPWRPAGFEVLLLLALAGTFFAALAVAWLLLTRPASRSTAPTAPPGA